MCKCEKNSTKENLIVITSGLIQKIDFLKNLKDLTCFFKATPVLKSLINELLTFNREKNNCLYDIVILNMFLK